MEAGFLSPAEDYLDKRLKLQTHLVKHELATFFLRAHGLSMKNTRINNGDLLIVDRAISAEHNKVVIAALDRELTTKCTGSCLEPPPES